MKLQLCACVCVRVCDVFHFGVVICPLKETMRVFKYFIELVCTMKLMKRKHSAEISRTYSEICQCRRRLPFLLSDLLGLLKINLYELPLISRMCAVQNIVKKVTVKCSRYRPSVAQRVGRNIALLFHDRGTRRG